MINSSNQVPNSSWTASSYLVYIILVILGVLVVALIAITVSYSRLKKRVDDKYTITASSPSTPISSRAYSASRSSGFTDPDNPAYFHGKHIKDSPFRSNAGAKSISSGSGVPMLSPHKKILNEGHPQHVYDNVGAIMY